MIKIAKIKPTAAFLYKIGRDKTRADIQKWANLLDHMSFRLPFPVRGTYQDADGRELVVLDIRTMGLQEGGHLIEDLTLEKELVEVI